MKRVIYFAAALVAVVLAMRTWSPVSRSQRAGSSAWIVRDGAANAVIVIAPEPARMTRLAAVELQTYVERMTGARLPVTSDPEPGAIRILLGESEFTRKLGLDVSALTDGAFRVASGADWVALLGPDGDYEPPEPWGRRRQRGETERVHQAWQDVTGAPFASPFHRHYMHYYPDQDVWEFDEAGTLNAVYAFLRALGVRWYAPGEIGEVVPELRDVPLPILNQTIQPDFPVRNLRHYFAQHGLGDVAAWNLRLGFNPGQRLLGHVQPGHGIKWVLLRPDMREAHPEYYAQYPDGRRSDIHPCLSSEGLFEKHVAYARAILDHYDEPMVNIDMPDGYGWGICRCDECRDQATPERGRGGSMSDYVWGYLDRVAREIHRSHPDRMVGGLAYSTYRQPPETIDQMSPNLAITLCRSRSRFYDEGIRDETRALRDAWLAKLPSGQMFIWEYYSDAGPKHRGIPVVFPRLIADDLRNLKGVSRGDLIEVYRHQTLNDYEPIEVEHAYDPFALNHLNIYITSRLWWDVDHDVDALLDEYYTLYYGPARDEMKAFMELAEAQWPGMRRDAESIGRILELSEAAVAVVDPETIYGERVQRVAEYVAPLYDLREQLGRAREDVPSARVLPVGPLASKTLDGRVDDPEFWSPVRGLSLREIETGNAPPSDRGMLLRVFRSGSALYFGLRCAEPDLANLQRPDPGADGRTIREGDMIEILLETNTHSYYRITVSADGVLVDADRGNETEEVRWSSGAEAAVHHGEDYWSVEVRVPLAGDGVRVQEPLSGVDGRMPSTTYPWYFNVIRQRVRDGGVERYAYSPTGSQEIEVLNRFAHMWSK